MERKEFLKKGFIALGAVTFLPFFDSCRKESTTSGDSTSTDSSTGTCAQYPSVTAGPYPTKNPANFVMSDIVSDRQGTALSIALTIKDYADSCAAATGVIVDVWQCDAGGNYSQYGDYASVDFLRGRQTTNSSGVVSFSSIYPGWYSGRTTHIHVHAYDASGNSLVVAQIAFPEATTSTVYAQGAYESHGQKDTSNASDDIFAAKNGTGTVLDISLATVSGSVSDGYTLSHSISY